MSAVAALAALLQLHFSQKPVLKRACEQKVLAWGAAALDVGEVPVGAEPSLKDLIEEVYVTNDAIDPKPRLAPPNGIPRFVVKSNWHPEVKTAGLPLLHDIIHAPRSVVGRRCGQWAEVSVDGIAYNPNSGAPAVVNPYRQSHLWRRHTWSATGDLRPVVYRRGVNALHANHGTFSGNHGLGLQERSVGSGFCRISGLLRQVHAAPQLETLPYANAHQRQGEESDGPSESRIGVAKDPVLPAIVRLLAAALMLLGSGWLQAKGWQAYYGDWRWRAGAFGVTGVLLGAVAVTSQFFNWTA